MRLFIGRTGNFTALVLAIMVMCAGLSASLGGAAFAANDKANKTDKNDKANKTAGAVEAPVTASYGAADAGRRLGDAKAPIVIVEYSSLTCPHCADFALKVMPDVKKNWIDTGKAQFIYRDFPWDQQAVMAASLARCVAPTKFFAFIDLLFREQANWVRPGEAEPNRDSLVRYAKLAGLTEDKAKSCLDDKKLQTDAVTQRSQAQTQFKVDSTPWLILNGEHSTAYTSYEAFNAALQKLKK